MSSLINESMQWASLHPHLAGLIVGLIACTESLAFIGLVVPGATLTLAAGALVGAGAMAFWSTFAWAAGGAVVGDGLSYWLGHRYQEQLRDLGPLRRHPKWLARGEAFSIATAARASCSPGLSVPCDRSSRWSPACWAWPQRVSISTTCLRR